MFHSRQHLIQWLIKNVTDKVLNIALTTGEVEVLGGFNPLPTSDSPGFLVRITSVYKSTYIVAVVADHRPRWFRVKDFSWRHYVGDIASNPLYQGDEPEAYKALKWGEDDPRPDKNLSDTPLHTQADGSMGDAEPGKDVAQTRAICPPVPTRKK
jgi:hypothetical protein